MDVLAHTDNIAIIILVIANVAQWYQGIKEREGCSKRIDRVFVSLNNTVDHLDHIKDGMNNMATKIAVMTETIRQ